MKNINKYIIIVINRKYFGFDDDYYSLSILFEDDSIIKNKRYFDCIEVIIWIIRRI